MVKYLVPPGKRASQHHVTSLKHARKLTTRYHALLTAREAAGSAAEIRTIEAEMEGMGGRSAYQEASALATSAFRSSRYIFKTLTRFALQPTRGELPLRVLEVGAVNAQLSVCPWMRVRAVDLRSRHKAVEEKDFFDVPLGSGPSGTPADVAPATAGVAAGAAPANVRDRVWGAAPSRLRASSWHPTPREGGAGVAAAVDVPVTALGGGGGKRKRKRVEAPEGAAGEEELEGAPVVGLPVAPPFDASHYSRPHLVPGAGHVVYHTHRSALPLHAEPPCAQHHVPLTGCYDIVVNAMVLNCGIEPRARVRMLVACRDHLVPGGILYFAVPSRCLEMSAFLTRSMMEGLFSALGFVVRHEKCTPKISFYMLQRVDVLPAAYVVRSAIPVAVGGAVLAREGGEGGPSGHGAAWRPVIQAATDAESGLLVRLAHNPPKPLPQSERPVSGFSLTEFALSCDPAWVWGVTGEGRGTATAKRRRKM